MSGFMNLLRKAVPHLPMVLDAVSAAKKSGVKGAVSSVVAAVLNKNPASTGTLIDLIKINAAATDDHQNDIEALRAEIKSLREQLATKK